MKSASATRPIKQTGTSCSATCSWTTRTAVGSAKKGSLYCSAETCANIRTHLMSSPIRNRHGKMNCKDHWLNTAPRWISVRSPKLCPPQEPLTTWDNLLAKAPLRRPHFSGRSVWCQTCKNSSGPRLRIYSRCHLISPVSTKFTKSAPRNPLAA